MSSGYPTALDAFSTTHVDDGTEIIHAASTNDLADAVNKIEAELGTLPKGAAADVKARFVATEAVANGAVAKSLVDAAGDLIIGSGADAVTRLAAGVAGQVLGGTGPSYAYPPGYQLAYVEFTANVDVSAGTEGTPVDVVSSGSITFDGTAHWIEFFSPETLITAGDELYLSLWEDSTDRGRIAKMSDPDATNSFVLPLSGKRKLTPSAAAHTFKVRGWTAGTTITGSVRGGAGGAGALVPGFIRIMKA